VRLNDRTAAVPPGSDFLLGSMSPVRAHISSAVTVLSAFMMSPARLPVVPSFRRLLARKMASDRAIRKMNVNGL